MRWWRSSGSFQAFVVVPGLQPSPYRSNTAKKDKDLLPLDKFPVSSGLRRKISTSFSEKKKKKHLKEADVKERNQGSATEYLFQSHKMLNGVHITSATTEIKSKRG